MARIRSDLQIEKGLPTGNKVLAKPDGQTEVVQIEPYKVSPTTWIADDAGIYENTPGQFEIPSLPYAKDVDTVFSRGGKVFKYNAGGGYFELVFDSVVQVIEASETDIATFAANSDNYTFQTGDFIAIPDGVGGYNLFIYNGGTKTDINSYLLLNVSQIDWSQVTNTPTTLAGYGITDAATSAQGALADTAIQPGDNASVLNNDAFVDLTTNQTIAGEKTFEGHMFRNNRLSTDYYETRVETRPVVDRLIYRTQPTQALSQASDYHGLDMSLETYNTNSNGYMSLYTAEFQAIHRENDVVRYLVPGYFRATNAGTGNVQEARCIRINSTNVSTGTIGTITGVYIHEVGNPSGTVTNQYGIKIESFSAAGSRNVGIEIGEMSGGALKNFGIESNASLNYFKGLRVGEITSINNSKLEIPADANPILIRGLGESVIIQEGGGVIDVSGNHRKASVMVGGMVTNSSSLFVGTPSVNGSYNSGFGIDGEYDSDDRVSTINIYAFGAKVNNLYSSKMSLKVTKGAGISEVINLSNDGLTITIIANAPGDFLTIDPATNKVTKRTASETRQDLQVNKLDGYTVATLPSSPTEGDTAYVTDADTPSYLTPVTGGGSVKCPVFYNGTEWVCH